MNPLRWFGSIPWTENRPTARLISVQDSKYENRDIHPCLERDMNSRSQCLSGQRTLIFLRFH